MAWHHKRDFFKRLPRQRKNRSFYVAALDTETIGLDGELSIVQLYHELWDEPRIYENVSDALEYIFSMNEKILSKTIWYSHNAEYDWRYMFEAFRRYDDEFLFQPMERTAGKFFQINVNSKTESSPSGRPKKITIFRDSMALFSSSLKEFTRNFAPQFEKQDIGLAYQNFERSNSVHIDYAKNDVLGLVAAVIRFDEIVYDKYGVHIKGTIASTAFQAMLRFLPEDEYHNRQSTLAEQFFRKSYYGGRVQLSCIPCCSYVRVVVYDINSSYPAQMRLGVPKGRAVSVWEYRKDCPGLYHVIASVPDDLLWPMIPHRNGNKLSFPTGTFETWVTSLEIDYASCLGCAFKILDGYIFLDGLTECFNDFVDVCEGLRTEYKGTPTEIVIKLMQNSVYGKFGTKPEGREVMLSFGEVPDDFLPIMDEETGDLLPNLYFKNEPRDAEYMMPHYAAWITANARIALDRAIRLAGAENVLYGDTDSIHTTPAGAVRLNETDVVGKRYGQFKLEKTYVEARYHAGKSYTAIIEGKEAEGIKVVCKGIPGSLLKIPDKADPQFAAKLNRRNELCARIHSGERVEVLYHSSLSAQAFLKLNKTPETPVRYKIRKRRSTAPENMYGHIVENGKFRSRRELCDSGQYVSMEAEVEDYLMTVMNRDD